MKAGFRMHAAALAAVTCAFAGAPANAADQTEWLAEQLKVTDGYEPVSRQTHSASGDRAAAAADLSAGSNAPSMAKVSAATTPASSKSVEQK